MQDPYLYEGSKTLKNLLNIETEAALDLAEAEISSASMMLLYEEGFTDFSAEGICYVHQFLFQDIYDWAGQYRVINIQKREKILAGASVWYSDVDTIDQDMRKAWKKIHTLDWAKLSREEFAKSVARLFPALWQVHPFREGNTRTIVMIITFFVEQYGYFFDRDLLAASAGYTRNAFVLASLDQNSEFEPLERILLDAISVEPIVYAEEDLLKVDSQEHSAKYSKYATNYVPVAHEVLSES